MLGSSEWSGSQLDGYLSGTDVSIVWMGLRFWTIIMAGLEVSHTTATLVCTGVHHNSINDSKTINLLTFY